MFLSVYLHRRESQRRAAQAALADAVTPYHL